MTLEEELFQGLGFWGFLTAIVFSGLVILLSGANGKLNCFKYSSSLAALTYAASCIIAIFSDEPKIFGWGILVVASCFGWWLLFGVAIVISAARDGRCEG